MLLQDSSLLAILFASWTVSIQSKDNGKLVLALGNLAGTYVYLFPFDNRIKLFRGDNYTLLYSCSSFISASVHTRDFLRYFYFINFFAIVSFSPFFCYIINLPIM